MRELDTAYNIAKLSLIPDTVLLRTSLQGSVLFTGTHVPKAENRRPDQEFLDTGASS